ncbi:zinc finger 1 [Hyphodiscus hymeniophilus]|uniref:Zinc finger 1 n=1 Tax=Hyphodiscus hymeniophilus TaxID=353542 RepID=A0A9P6VHJ0_9HELO|nr:zinc finger 1 [Hyphodiscus hymeniophilus]
MTERTLLQQTREEYEEDSVSVTSSRSEEYDPDEEFLVERILAERKGDDGKKLYLISWANFPEEKSTWEPRRNIQDPDILAVWKERKHQESNGLESPFDLAEFNARIQRLCQEKEERHRRRKAKRKRRGIPVSPDPELHRQLAENSDSTEDVESDGIPENSSPEATMKPKMTRKSKKKDTVSVRGSDESDDFEDASPSDDSLMGELARKEKRKDKKIALESVRDKGAATQSKKIAESKSSLEKPAQKLNERPPSSSSSSDVPLADVAEKRRQAQELSESTDTAISRQLATTIQGPPKLPLATTSRGLAAFGIRDRPIGSAAPAIAKGGGATRGGSSLGPKNVFSSRGCLKKRPTLIENSADSSKNPKLYGNMRIRRKAELAGRAIAERAPDIEALGGLFRPADPSTFHNLKPAYRKIREKPLNPQDSEDSSMDTGDLFVGQNSPKGSLDAWAPTPDDVVANSPHLENQQAARPDYQQGRHGFGAICHFWRLRGSCDKGYQCPFAHDSEEVSPHLPFGPPPPDHMCNCQRPRIDSSHEPLQDSRAEQTDARASWPQYNALAQSSESLRPQYDQGKHGYNAVCHFYLMRRGDCEKGSDCRYLHSNDRRLPYAPPPPDHRCHCQPDHELPAGDFSSHLPVVAEEADHLVPLLRSSRPFFNSRDPAVCPFFLEGHCNRGASCKFLHTDDIQYAIAPKPNQKDKPCQYFNEGRCTKTARECAFFHGRPGITPEQIEQSDSLDPNPTIRDVTAIAKGARKSVAFATDEPMLFSDEPESYSLPKATPTTQARMEFTAGPRKATSSAINEPIAALNEFDRFDTRGPAPPRDSGSGTVPRDPKYNRFWQKGTCRFGDGCPSLHPSDEQPKEHRVHAVIPNFMERKQNDDVGGFQYMATGEAHKPNINNGSEDLYHGHPLLQESFLEDSANVPLRTPNHAYKEVGRYENHGDGRSSESGHRISGGDGQKAHLPRVHPEIVPTKPSRPTLSMNMESYRRKKAVKALGDGVKEVTFGKDETSSIVVDFGNLNSVKEHSWGQTLAALTTLRFTKLCLAQDFQAQFSSHQSQKLWQGSLGSGAEDEEAIKTMDRASEYLRLSSAGFVAVYPEFIVLVYPASEEWRFIEGTVSFPAEIRLRYFVFRSNLDFSTPPASRIQSLGDYRKNLMESVHELDFNKFVPKINPKNNYYFYLLFPSTAQATADFIIKWLQGASKQCKIYSSQTEGAWDCFVKDPKVRTGIVLIHESAVASLCELPGLRRLIASDLRDKSCTFWYISEGAAEYPMYGPPATLSPGQITSTRLLPHGHAFLLTPSFLIAEPERAYGLLKWFVGKHEKASPGTWKLVCAHNIREYPLDVAIEKSAERDGTELEYQGQARKDAVIEERGLSYSSCSLRFQMHEIVVKILSQPETSHFSEYCDSDIGDEFSSPIIYADKFIDANDEEALVTWFAGWAMGKLDQFRKFTVVGTGLKSQNRAVRKMTIVESNPGSAIIAKDLDLNISGLVRLQDPDHSKGTKRSKSPSDSRASKRLRDDIAKSPVASSKVATTPVKGSGAHPEAPSAIVTLAFQVALPAEISPASPLQDTDEEMSVDPPQIDGAADKGPASSASNNRSRSGFHDVEPQESDVMEVDSPMIEDEPRSENEMEKGNVITKEIKYEATTTWYQRWYKEGKGWEHIYVDSWEKLWKYLGVKEGVPT